MNRVQIKGSRVAEGKVRKKPKIPYSMINIDIPSFIQLPSYCPFPRHHNVLQHIDIKNIFTVFTKILEILRVLHFI